MKLEINEYQAKLLMGILDASRCEMSEEMENPKSLYLFREDLEEQEDQARILYETIAVMLENLPMTQLGEAGYKDD